MMTLCACPGPTLYDYFVDACYWISTTWPVPWFVLAAILATLLPAAFLAGYLFGYRACWKRDEGGRD